MSKSLLIVDDEPIIREGLSRCLDWAEIGITRVLTAGDGAEAYKMISRGGIDIVLTDIVMPELTGLELVEKCRAEGLDCIFLILSSYSEFEYMHGAILQRVSDYILKPCDPQLLWETLVRLLSESDEGTPGEAPADAPPRYSGPIATALSYMEEHLGDSALTLTRIAHEVLFMNADYFGKLFKRECGVKFSTYLLSMRMDLARRLLADTNDSIGLVAEACGFGCNYAYFSQIFRLHTGSTPSDFRSAARRPAY